MADKEPEIDDAEPQIDEDAGPDDGGEKAAPDPEMMKKLMASLGGGGEGGGGMDMASLQAMLGGMGGAGEMGGMMGGMGGGMPGGPPAAVQQQAQANQAAAAEKNAGEQDAEDGKYKWEQTSKYGESEVIVRFPLAAPATKRDVKVVFKAKELKVVVKGEELLNGKTFASTHPDDSTWCLVENGSELQVLLALAEDSKWNTLLAN
uniref:CS domain-containing protein n=1 Tax=Haptolina ericina TaxID=156174 RepID=A0A7S3AR43_9EUKA|mmetsp:Transcript_31593/g.71380  ORF Transcript_31593/g.71380 Transcript_31593/m.71380 type:complete len:205 (+) Transcript_31593:92-706(+)